uniref:PrsW family intramembrane metalloprotease n=2 Tax=Litorilinea aerophila TaxID=1204385 RepID=A0A540VKK9_9CHLR
MTLARLTSAPARANYTSHARTPADLPRSRLCFTLLADRHIVHRPVHHSSIHPGACPMDLLAALLISLFAAVIPNLFYVAIFYWADRYEREPLWLASLVFIWGAIPAIIASLVGEILIGSPFIDAPGSVAEAVMESAVVAPVVEELAKGLVLLIIFRWMRQEFDGLLDGLLYGALVGFGFAMTENFFYFVGAFDQGGFGHLSLIIFLRAVIFGLNHAFYTALIGMGLGLARHATRRSTRLLYIGLGLLAAILTHSLHNLGASLASINALGLLLSLMVAGGGFGLILVVTVLAWQHERHTIRTELADEVGDLLAEEEFQSLTRQRWRRPFRRRPQAERDAARRRQLCVELAMRKHRLRLLGAEREPELLQDIQRLREELRETRPSLA